ncbi:MAG: hypothetical protein M1817_001832 [Caeruleum heppii]|nr:MAG: hypothetical protein M1817_001832 [Caeruleum heppii]
MYSLSILIFRGEPLDLRSTRHSALYLSNDQSVTKGSASACPTALPPCPPGDALILHVTGGHGFFALQENSDIDPRRNEDFHCEIPVFSFPASGLKFDLAREVTDVIKRTPINNKERDWNCQTWVAEALGRCAEMGLITREGVDAAVDQMVDVLMEVPEDE